MISPTVSPAGLSSAASTSTIVRRNDVAGLMLSHQSGRLID